MRPGSYLVTTLLAGVIASPALAAEGDAKQDADTPRVAAVQPFNQLAIVQLAPGVIPAGGLTNAQVMNGRTVTGSLRFSF